MSPFFDDLEAQLHAAAHKHAGASQPRRRWVRTGAPVIAAVAVTVAVVVIAFTLRGEQGGHPATSAAAQHKAAGVSVSVSSGVAPVQIGPLSPRQQREWRYVTAAQAKALKTRACDRVGPSTSNGAPSHALLSELGVLRRTRTAQDMPSILGNSRRFPIGGVQGTYVRYFRLAQVRAGVSYYVVPARRLDPLAAAGPACEAKQVANLRADLPRIPPALRSGALALQAQSIAALKRAASGRPHEAVCMFAAQARSLSGTCGTVADLERKGMVVPYGTTITGVVPDGVASVTLHYRAIRGFPEQTITSEVAHNMFVASAARAPDGAYPATIVWRSASGAVLKAVSPATP
jgi:hypothetical protein